LKKYLALILGVLFVLSFAASAFAIHAEIPSETQAVVAKTTTQITLGGELRVRGWWRSNINVSEEGFALPIDANDQAYYDERVRLSLDANVAPGVEGFVMLESNNEQSDLYTWGNFNSKPTNLSINEAWIVYAGSGLLGFNSGLKIGHMPLALGQKEFFDHTKFGDDAIVFFMSPVKGLEVALLTVKFAGDGSPSTVVLPASIFGGFGSVAVNLTGSKYDNTDDLDGYVGLATYKIDDKNTVGVNYTYLNQSDLGMSHQDLGLHADGNISGFGYKAFGDIQFGKLFDGTSIEQDFKGYAFGLGISYMVNPVNLRASFAWGSGDDDSTDNDIDAFVPYLGDDQHYTLIYEYKVTPAGGYTNAGLSNTNYYNLGVDYSPTKDLALSLDGYLIYATETPSGVDDNCGWEVDGKIKYNLAKNLTYQIDAGYFDAGDFYKDLTGQDAKGVTLLRHAITLSF
jgi:hypothetical protein